MRHRSNDRPASLRNGGEHKPPSTANQAAVHQAPYARRRRHRAGRALFTAQSFCSDRRLCGRRRMQATGCSPDQGFDSERATCHALAPNAPANQRRKPRRFCSRSFSVRSYWGAQNLAGKLVCSRQGRVSLRATHSKGYILLNVSMTLTMNSMQKAPDWALFLGKL